LLYLSRPVIWGGSLYQGLNGALLYSRSSDGGQTWDYQHVVIEGMTSEGNYGFMPSTYEWAASKGDNIAFLVGDNWSDFFLMKSDDGGDTWTKIIIWEHPYPNFDFSFITDTLYCPDGAHHLAFDSDHKIHVVFGITRAFYDGFNRYYEPAVDGIGYWNEDLPVFSSDINALCPYPDCENSELTEDLTLIGWSQDLNGNGQIDLTGSLMNYSVGLSSQPQIVIDEMDRLYVVYSSVTESYDNGLANYRHLWARGSWDEGAWGNFTDLTGDLIHAFDECVYPSVSSTTDENIYLVYQVDGIPGIDALGAHPTTDNDIILMRIPKADLIPVGIRKRTNNPEGLFVSQNFPNPFGSITQVEVEVARNCIADMEVTDLAGRLMYHFKANLVRGRNLLKINASGLAPGNYFYTISGNSSVITRKMTVAGVSE